MGNKRAYRFRFFPTPEQEAILARTFGCARFAYNYMLRHRTDAWDKRQERISYHESSAELTALKKTPEYAWLNEVGSVPVQQALRHLQTAFANCFAGRAGYPSFRRRNGVQSAEYTTSAFRWNGSVLALAKMRELLAIRWSHAIPKQARVTTCTVSKDSASRYPVSMLCDESVSAKEPVLAQVGVDLGLKHFAVLSTGEKISAPNVLRKNEKKLAKLSRRLAKKQKGSARRAKAKLKVAKLHNRTARLINENQVIVVESLSVKNMLKNRSLAKSIGDAGWAEFVRQLQYKAQWYGRTLIGIDRWYPSSKRCSDCGHTLAKMPLSARAWNCPECESIHDRDINAARNVLAAGLAVSAHGESVNPMSR